MPYRIKAEFTEEEVVQITKCLDTTDTAYGRMKGINLFEPVPEIHNIKFAKDSGMFNAGLQGRMYGVAVLPEMNQSYYFIDENMRVTESRYEGGIRHEGRLEVRNFFDTRQEAEAAAEKVRALLLSLHN